MGSLHKDFMMNKLFLIYIAFNLAVVYAQPTNESSDLAKLPKEQRQCAANKMMLKTLANLMEADKRGEVQNVGECSDLTGCLVTLAGTIAACAADLVDWPLVVACVLELLELVINAMIVCAML